MDFQTRFSKLNDRQRSAVEQIYGPLLIIAGPGTGKTELLSVRAANILRQTDTLPSNILCLTYTENGAMNMRERLQQIIGKDAYKVAIHTFHGFGVEVINQHREYFFDGSDNKPADELAQHQILQQIFEKLERDHPLASINHLGEFTYISDARTIISEFKKSGLTILELRQIVSSNQQTIDQINSQITEVFSSTVTKATIEAFATLASAVSQMEKSDLPDIVPDYAETLALSMAHAVNEALELDKTNPITAWKNKWCTKNTSKQTVLKDSLQTAKLLAVIDIYEQYVQSLRDAGLYDYDDMIQNVLQAINDNPDLKANLSEKYQFIMVDEFQDTNLAQLRLLFALTDYDAPNVMAVGDDDQAIFSFQGADVGNIQRFRERYNNPEIIVLKDNYRSDQTILTASRQVITQGQDRLENTIVDLSKELTPWASHESAKVEICKYASEDAERYFVAKQISELVASGVPAESIAVIANKHSELISFLSHLSHVNLQANYERYDNALDHELVKLIELIARAILAIRRQDHSGANALLPELIAHKAWGFEPIDIWRLSLSASQNRQHWLEVMQANSVFEPFATWLIGIAVSEQSAPIEQQIDQLIGINTEIAEDEYRSPVGDYFFSPEQLQTRPDAYLDALESLRTIRDSLRNHFDTDEPSLDNFIQLIDAYHRMKIRLGVTRSRASNQAGSVNLLTAHASKGLEFDHVFILSSTDNKWGEKARTQSRNISYPANLPLAKTGNNYDERLRLFFVAMTRAKQTLHISYSEIGKTGKPQLIASFLSGEQVSLVNSDIALDIATEIVETDWRDRLTTPITSDLRTLLAPKLENYRLSATHLNNFLDVTHGGPQKFLLNNLLQFPQAKSANASFGTAVHNALQFAQLQLNIHGELPTVADIQQEFTKQLTSVDIPAQDFEYWHNYGQKILDQFMTEKSSLFKPGQQAELNFANQGVLIGEAKLTGKLDIVDIDKQAKTIHVTDYKTGKPSREWKKSDVKQHKYRQQLMFYQLMVEKSKDYADYTFTGANLQFIEPDAQSGEIWSLEDRFEREELDRFERLISAVWRKITTLDLPDISGYEQNYKGVVQFEEDLVAGDGL